MIIMVKKDKFASLFKFRVNVSEFTVNIIIGRVIHMFGVEAKG